MQAYIVSQSTDVDQDSDYIEQSVLFKGITCFKFDHNIRIQILCDVKHP